MVAEESEDVYKVAEVSITAATQISIAVPDTSQAELRIDGGGNGNSQQGKPPRIPSKQSNHGAKSNERDERQLHGQAAQRIYKGDVENIEAEKRGPR